MKVQLLSDLHIEFEDYSYPESDCDVVVLAGDIHTKDRGVKWAIDNIKDKPVIYVLGNHEYYTKTYPKLAIELFGDPKIAGYHCQTRMTDYKKIKRMPNYSKIRSIDIAMAHKQSIKWLEKVLNERKNEANVVVTHHGPSRKSVPENYQDDMLTAAYVSDLDTFIETHQPKLWLHGHLHNNSDYTIGNCRVLCNPKGYAGEENEDFSPTISIDI